MPVRGSPIRRFAPPSPAERGKVMHVSGGDAHDGLQLEELVEEAWRERAPVRVRKAYDAAHG